MAVACSLGLAWLFLGVKSVMDAFSGDPINRPMWTYRATNGKVLAHVLLIWPFSYWAEAQAEVGFRDPKAPLVAVFAFATELASQTLVFWSAYTLAVDLASGLVGRVLLVLLFVALGSAILKPMIRIASGAVGGLILAILYPKRDPNVQP